MSLRIHRIVINLAKLVLLLTAFISVASSAEKNRTGTKSEFELSFSQPSLEQSISMKESDLSRMRFVQIEVVRVVNPHKVPIWFSVSYQTEREETVNLGSFSLFPPDNPGKFIIPTHGISKPNGKLRITLKSFHKMAPKNNIRVWIKVPKFIH